MISRFSWRFGACCISWRARVEDGLGAAVVLFQQALGAVRKMLFEVLHVRQVCSPEAVDGLVIVTHHTQVVPGQLLDQLELGIVGVLELVDQDVGEPFAVAAEDGRPFVKEPHGLVDHIIEVEQVFSPLVFLVGPVDFEQVF